MVTRVVELLGSMRFAVSLLVFICLASLIGTVVPQNQPPTVYVDLFGPFWLAVFEHFAVGRVYNSAWFLGVMAFLVVSTTLCLVRNAPKMLRAARNFRVHVRGDSLRNIPHRVELALSDTPDVACARVQALLARQGYAVRVRVDGSARLLAGKKGSANRLGYVFAHAAIVVICIGGLLDSELLVRLQVWLGNKHPVTENMFVAQVPPAGRLSAGNPSFRANLRISEGSQSSSAIVAVGQGVLVQPLPFTLKLKQFLVEYYSTGMPSSFKSEVEVRDLATGATFEQTIEVNHPLRYRGVTVYQSSFDDGGSRLALSAWPLRGLGARAVALHGAVGESVTWGEHSVQFVQLRPINVENLAAPALPQPKPLMDHVASVSGSAVLGNNDHLVNVGPSIEYRLTAADGQAREFVQYMRPLVLDGELVFLAGVREVPGAAYRYLRIPADTNQSVAQFMALRAALADEGLRAQAAQRFAQTNASARLSGELLERAAHGALTTFAAGGIEALVARAPADQHEKIMEFAVPMIQVSLGYLLEDARTRAGLSVPAPDHAATQAQQRWLQLALVALANLPAYDAPVFLQLDHFDLVQASVFQVTRTPGKPVVYLGCLLLVLGIFVMFYIHERRVWVWLRTDAQPCGRCTLLAAMSAQRRNLDFEAAFAHFKTELAALFTHDPSPQSYDDAR